MRKSTNKHEPFRKINQMKWNVGTKIGVGFGAALAIFVIISALSYRGLTQVVETSNWRKHTYDVLIALDDLHASLNEVELGQRSYALTGEQAFLERYRAALGKIDVNLLNVRTLTADNPDQQRRLDLLAPLISSRLQVSAETVDLRRGRGLEAAVQQVKTTKGKMLMDDIHDVISQMGDSERVLLEKRTAATQNDILHAKRTIVFGTCIALALAAIGGAMVTRNVARPLRQLTEVAEKITAGNLNVTLPANSRSDEVGLLGQAFGRMTASLRLMAVAAEKIAAGDLRTAVTPQSADDALGNAFARMAADLQSQIRALAQGANVLGSAASEIVASTSQLTSSASEAAAAVAETTTTVEEVRQTAQLASQKARLVSDGALQSIKISEDGRKSAADIVDGMQQIRLQMDAIAASMVRLSGQSQAIGQIIATVEDVATQSNLLAVNAAIEAAKAGEHGKGFGVVAQEVRSLAEQSRQATTQVRTILGDIQQAANAAAMATEEGGKAVDSGYRQTEIAGSSIQALAVSVNEAAQAAIQIAASSQQQLIGVDQVAGAMESIRQASSQNAASATQLESAARNLDEIGRQLRQMVSRYLV
jgi:methyl-accepting chemotaxis protein